MRWRVRASTVSGDAVAPGDKSISHRALMLGALSDGVSTIGNLAPGADVRSTMTCLESLGARITSRNGSVEIYGGSLTEAPSLDAGNSGTTMRLLAGILAGQPFLSRIGGDESLTRRPMDRIVEPLRRMGADVSAHDGHAPLEIRGGALHGITHRSPTPSAQVKSCVLLAGLFADGETVVEEASPTRDHTERMLRAAGARVVVDGVRVFIQGPAKLKPLSLTVPGDFSSAGFLLTAGALTSSPVTITGVGLNPTRTAFLDVLRDMGCEVRVDNETEEEGEARGNVSVTSSGVRGVDIDAARAAACIDELPLVALLGSLAEGKTSVVGAAELRVKETDRIAATVGELSKLGARIRELPDGFEVEGPATLQGANVESHGDHRIAMMLAIAGIVADGETVVHGVECADISFPGIAESLAALGANVDAG